MWRVLRVVVFFVLVQTVAWGQGSRSPISAQGIGDIHDFALINNEGMGGVGISAGSLWYLNSINPALLPMNTLTVFQGGFIVESRSVESNELSSKNTGGNLSYLATAFPVKTGRWTTSLGLKPFSSVEYQYTSEEQINGSNGTGINTFRGEGGFNEFYWANGVKLGKSFFLGVRASYLFSSITRTSITYPIDTATFSQTFETIIADRVSVSDVKFSFGTVYSFDSLFNSRLKFNIGAVYELGSEINANRLIAFDKSPRFGLPFQEDTLFNEDGAIYLPASYGIGLTLSNGLKWTAAIDIKQQQWSEYKNFNGSNENLQDATHILIGGEYTPDITSVSSYLKRVTYRAGFNYSELPYVLNNQQVKEVGINFGMSLPVGRYSSLDLSMRYGRRGDVAETSIQEDVLRFGLGISFNDQWFIRRKYD